MASSRARFVAAARGRAFSLVELMIAIVILGIGLVMVATLFPVGIQQTQEAVELSVAPSVADQAIATLKMKLKSWSDYEATHPGGNTATQDIIDFTLATNQNDAEFAISQAAKEQSDWPNDPWGGLDPNEVVYPGFFPIPCDNFVRLPSRAIPTDNLMQYLTSIPPLVITENRDLTAPALSAIRDRDQEFARLGAAIIDRLLVDAGEPTQQNQLPAQPDFIRTKITAFDRVFPPVALSRNDGQQWWTDPAIDFNFIDQCARRRYAWKAFAMRVNTPKDFAGTPGAEPASAGQRVFKVVIVVLKRAAPTLKFPAQQYSGSYPVPAPYAVGGAQLSNDFLSMANPATAAPTLDTLFPQPWLIGWDILNFSANFSVNYPAGQFICIKPTPGTTPGIANLLPPGSVFIDFATGTPHKVISRTFGAPGSLSDLIQIAPEPDSAAVDPDGWGGNPGPWPVPGAELAWIFPPAYDPATNQFSQESPVVDVFTTEIAID